MAAWDAARLGSSVLLTGFQENLLNYQDKRPLEVDYFLKEAQRGVLDILLEAFPDYPVLIQGHEIPPSYNPLGPRWYLVTLDGIRNFAKLDPFFSISLSLVGPSETGELKPLLGVVQAPVLMEMFFASIGDGAFHVRQTPGKGLTEGSIFVSGEKKLANSFVRTGLSSDFRPEDKIKVGFPNNSSARALKASVLKEVGSFGEEGSVSLNLAYVASGKLEGYFDLNLGPFELLAGNLILSEAGGTLTDFQGKEYQWGTRADICASNFLVHPFLLEVLQKYPGRN